MLIQNLVFFAASNQYLEMA